MQSCAFMINIKNKNIVIIGGGKVAERKIITLLSYQPNIKVISPSLSKGLKTLVNEKKIMWINKKFEKNDIKEAFLIIAATNNKLINREVISYSQHNQLVMNVSEANLGNVMMPATFTKGNLHISVSTNGTSPIIAKKIRDEIKSKIDDKIIENLEIARHERKKIIKTVKEPAKRKELLNKTAENIRVNHIDC